MGQSPNIDHQYNDDYDQGLAGLASVQQWFGYSFFPYCQSRRHDTICQQAVSSHLGKYILAVIHHFLTHRRR